jgi:hypothetical protein
MSTQYQYKTLPFGEARTIMAFRNNYYKKYHAAQKNEMSKERYEREKKQETCTLHRMNKYNFPEDMLWEVWWFIPAAVKQQFADLRLHRVTCTYVTNINRLLRYEHGKLIDLLSAVPTNKLFKYIRYGSPAKYYIKPAWRTENTLYEHIQADLTNSRFDIIYNLINMVIELCDGGKIAIMTKLINSIIHIHRKYSVEGITYPMLE